jgi:hypothetical protein
VIAVGLALGAALLADPGAAAGQDLESRVRDGEGTVAFHFEVDDGVEVCDDGIVMNGDRRMYRERWDREDRNCSEGMAEAVVTVRAGEVRDVELEAWEGAGSAPAGARDLGRVSPADAAAFFLAVARSDRDRPEAASDAILASTLARDVEVWPRLLDLARDGSMRGKVRKSAVFWLGQEAADAVTEGLADLAADEEEDQEVREAAVFALSQRPDDEAVPVLMELARSAREARTRRSAMFWLAQSKDPRVLAFFESILVDRGGGD